MGEIVMWIRIGKELFELGDTTFKALKRKFHNDPEIRARLEELNAEYDLRIARARRESGQV